MYNLKLCRHVGMSLQKRREELGLSLSDAASALDIKTEDLEEYEAGEKEIFNDVLLKLKRVFGIDIENYFKDSE